MFTKPALLLRFEGAVALVVSILLYRESHTSWILFAVLFLSPDLFMLGYLVNTRIGAEAVPPMSSVPLTHLTNSSLSLTWPKP
jgi:hypothetical protein